MNTDTKDRLKRTGFTFEDVLHMYAPMTMTSDDLESWDGTSPNAEDGAEQYNAISSKNWDYVQAALKDKLDAEKVYTSKELYEILYGLAKDKDEYIQSTFNPGHSICPIMFTHMADDFYDLDRPDQSFAWNTETNQKVHTGYLPR